ncbi:MULTISPECIES: hypothetical protein [unclassified Microcoleus]|uniref:hypothetical protein n=1 Tax=unclassified Microcoleus TaxID=2642155 RepID=UPI0018823A58|nr:hypothetical protein [Tychonema sp. LEGE 06208]
MGYSRFTDTACTSLFVELDAGVPFPQAFCFSKEASSPVSLTIYLGTANSSRYLKQPIASLISGLMRLLLLREFYEL